MARQYLFHNGEQIPLNGQDFWVGTHEQFANANPPIPKGTLLYFTDGETKVRQTVSKAITLNGGSSSTTGYTDTQVDFSDVIPSGAKNICVTMIRLGGYMMPYFEGRNASTYPLTFSNDTKKLIIRNYATTWSNYTAYFDVYYEL